LAIAGPGYCASFIEADLADVVAPFDNDDEDATFTGEVTGISMKNRRLFS
jgi:hypothetical protein